MINTHIIYYFCIKSALEKGVKKWPTNHPSSLQEIHGSNGWKTATTTSRPNKKENSIGKVTDNYFLEARLLVY